MRNLKIFIKMISFKVTVLSLSILVFVDKVNSDENNRMIDIEWEPKHPAFDPEIYKEILDPVQCAKQLKYLTLNDTLLMMTCKYLDRSCLHFAPMNKLMN